jgi:hypothetical protein
MDVHENKRSKCSEYRRKTLSLFRTSLLSRFASCPPANPAKARTLLESDPIKIFHWRYRNIASVLMNFLRLGYDSLMGAALESRQYGGLFDEEIRSCFGIRGSRFSLVLFSVGHAA